MRLGLRQIFLLILSLLGSPTVYAMEPPVKEVAITFDDLPYVDIGRESPTVYRQRMSKLSQALSTTQTPAVGFVNELLLYRNGAAEHQLVAILEDWMEHNLELGNHTYAHTSLHTITFQKFEQAVRDGERISRPLMAKYGKTMRYFRFPYLHVGLDTNMRVDAENMLKNLGYTVAPITFNISDWAFAAAYHKAERRKEPQQKQRIVDAYLTHINEAISYAENIADELFGRPIRHILGLHANALNAEHYHRIATLLQQRGYRFITLDRALSDPAYNSEDTYSGPLGESWLHHWAVTVGLNPIDEPKVPSFIRGLAGREAIQYQ